MPELPEVETVRAGLTQCLVGCRVAAVSTAAQRLRTPLDQPALARLLVGAEITAVRRRAKYLLVDVADPAAAGGADRGSLLVHLGMSGRLRWQRGDSTRGAHEHVVVRLLGGCELRYHDPRRFGLVEALPPGGEACDRRLCGLGREPLGPPPVDGAFLYGASRQVRAPVKAWLMDARVLVGVGNIYASEALHAAGIHPLRRAGSLSAPRCARLAEAVAEVLLAAIAKGGTTLRDFADADGNSGLFLPRLAVYGRTGLPCGRCRRPLRRRLIAGRSSFYCPGCQR